MCGHDGDSRVGVYPVIEVAAPLALAETTCRTAAAITATALTSALF